MRRVLVLLAVLCVCPPPASASPQKPLASVPFELVGEKIFMKARINGSEEINLQFDTGAGSAVIDSAAAVALGLTARGQTKNEGTGGTTTVPVSLANVIEVQGLKFEGIPLLHFDLGEYLGTRRDAIIGYDMLQRYVVKIDYDSNTMEFYDAAHFKYSGTGRKNSFRIWSNSALMDLELTLMNGKTLHGKFMVDNGADLALLVNTPFVDKHGLMQNVGKVAKGSTTGSDGSEVATFRGMVQAATIGGFRFTDFPVRLTQTQSGTLSLEELDGILGNPFLKMFNITFDYRRKKMYWEPNRLFSQKVK